MKTLILKAIYFYQRTLSLDHGPLSFLRPHGLCKYYPSCSVYTYDAVKQKGVIRGLFMGARRVMRCNPWSQGGFDPVRK